MGADRGDLAAQVLATPLAQGVGQIAVPRAAVRQGHGLRRAGQVSRRPRTPGERARRRAPGGHAASSDPAVAKRSSQTSRVATMSASSRFPAWRRTDARCRRTRSTSDVRSSNRGMLVDEHLVEVLATAGRTVLDEVEIVGGEDGDPDGLGQLGPAADRLAVDLGPGRPGDGQLRLDEDPARRPSSFRPAESPARRPGGRGRRGRPLCNDRCVASHPTASRTDVLPDPLGPRNTVRPCGSGSTRASEKQRKSVSQSVMMAMRT